MRTTLLRAAAVLGSALALVALAAPAFATDFKTAGPTVTVTGDGGDVTVAGASVTVTGTASDLKAAGALVNLNVATTGSAMVSGAQVSVAGTVGGALGAGGAVVEVTGAISGNSDIGGAVVRVGASTAGNLRVGGASVTIEPGNDVRGTLQAFGANVTIAGHIGGRVQAGGALVTFDGQADGPVELSGYRIVLGPNARIGGDLTVRSPNPLEQQPGATVSGATNQIAVSSWQVALFIAVGIALGTILAGIVLLLFGGHIFITATEHVRHRPLSSFLFGILTLVVVPFIALVLIVSAIGFSIGLAIALILPFLVVFGHAIAAAGVASGLLVRSRREIGIGTGLLMLVIGAIVLVAVSFIPWVGPALVAIALILGIGAFTRTVGGRIRRNEPRPPPVVV